MILKKRQSLPQKQQGRDFVDKIIYVVDDVPTNLAVTRAVLEDLYTVVTISSGTKALKLLPKVKPNLILLDIDMPELDGFEVLKQLKEIDEYKNIPVVFLSGMVESEVKERGIKMGAVDFISKPFSPFELIEKVGLYCP